jgi:hypothetical protein
VERHRVGDGAVAVEEVGAEGMVGDMKRQCGSFAKNKNGRGQDGQERIKETRAKDGLGTKATTSSSLRSE